MSFLAFNPNKKHFSSIAVPINLPKGFRNWLRYSFVEQNILIYDFILELLKLLSSTNIKEAKII